MTEIAADIYLKRAFALIEEVQKSIHDFRQHAIDHTDSMEKDQPFLQGILAARRGSKHLQQQKTALIADLQLADQEIDKAVGVDSAVRLETGVGLMSPLSLRSLIVLLSGQLEMIWGNIESAKVLLNSSIQIMEIPDAHYMLGLLLEAEYKPTEALQHFERCLELDPSGELSVSALREAQSMRNYRKRFRGSWGTFAVLLVFFFPAAFLYLFVKWK